MNETYLNLMAETKKKDEKAYAILNKIKNHPVYAFLKPYNSDTFNGMMMILFAPVIAQAATLFDVLPGKGVMLIILLLTFVLGLTGIWLTSSYFSTVWMRRKKPGVENAERLPLYCMCVGVFFSVLYLVLSALVCFAPQALPVNLYFAGLTENIAFLFNLLALFSYIFICWGYSRDLGSTLISAEECDYLNAFFLDNALRDENGSIKGKYGVTNEGVVYYMEGKDVSVVLPFGKPDSQLSKTVVQKENGSHE